MRKLNFGNNILFTLTTALLIMIGSAVFVNYSIQSIVDDISEEAKPDKRLVLLKGVMYHITNAENNVKSYGLTLEDNYLYEYDNSIVAAEAGIDLLYNAANTDSAFRNGIISIDTLIHQKFNGLDELVRVQNEQSVNSLLSKIKETVEDINDETMASLPQDEVIKTNNETPAPEKETTDEPKKETFFKRIFGNRKNKNKDGSTSSPQSSSTNSEQGNESDNSDENTSNSTTRAEDVIEASFERIDEEIAAIKEKETAYEIELKKKELALIQQDRDIKLEIAAIVNGLEEKEQDNLQAEIMNADNQRTYTGVMIAIFCFLSCGLLALAGYIIYTYVKRNNAYKKELKKAKNETESKNNEIIGSITYAKRIQDSILPKKERINTLFDESFVIYEPKDIVAGDFYWMKEIDGFIFMAVADCTGHGVPGAMVSMTCSGALTRSVIEFGLRQPASILDKCREIIMESFDGGDIEVFDGMDICLCRFDKTLRQAEYAGAHNPLLIYRNGEIKMINADRQPVARYVKAQPFTNHEVKLLKGDQLFFYTDGYIDQFGGEKGKKFMLRNFHKVILANARLPLKEQGGILLDTLRKWQGDFDQIDDICIIGVKI